MTTGICTPQRLSPLTTSFCRPWYSGSSSRMAPNTLGLPFSVESLAKLTGVLPTAQPTLSSNWPRSSREGTIE